MVMAAVTAQNNGNLWQSSKGCNFVVVAMGDAKPLKDLVQDTADLSELAAVGMQVMVMLDDIDDKFIDKPHLLAAVNIERAEVDELLRLARKLVDELHTAKDMTADEAKARG